MASDGRKMNEAVRAERPGVPGVGQKRTIAGIGHNCGSVWTDDRLAIIIEVGARIGPADEAALVAVVLPSSSVGKMVGGSALGERDEACFPLRLDA